jgi:hypothetical protein
MKNIHILPTQNEITSKLFKVSNELKLTRKYDFYNGAKYQNIYITSDKEIKEGDWVIKISSIYKGGGIAQKYSFIDAQFEDIIFKKIILTTDPSLDGVQAIDDDFLEWFVKNPNCEKIEIKTRYLHSYKTGETFISLSKTPEFSSRNMQCIKIEPRYEIIIPQEEPKQENCCTPAGQIKRYVDCVGCDRKPKEMSKQTAVEWFNDEIIIHLNFDQRLYLKDILKQAKEMEKEQSQNYAIFAIRCDRTEMRILEFNDYIKLEENENK